MRKKEQVEKKSTRGGGRLQMGDVRSANDTTANALLPHYKTRYFNLNAAGTQLYLPQQLTELLN